MAGEIQDKVKPVKLFSVSSTPEGWNEALAPIIFIPGFFSNNRTFSGVRYKISKRTKRKVYSIDLRNHGKSEYSDEFNLEHSMADLLNFMQDQDIPKAVLAGHSMGGKVALGMALKHPEKVEKLIVEDIPLQSSKAQNDILTQSFNTMKALHYKLQALPKEMSAKEAQNLLVPIVAKYFPVAMKNFTNAKSELILPFHKAEDGSFEWAMNIDVMLNAPDYFEKFEVDLTGDPTFNGGTLLLAGGKSFVRVQDHLDDYYKHFPNFDCRLVENGFHTPHVEFPDIYIKSVSKLVGEE